MRRRREGFTLIELLVVIAIIGLLAAILTPAVKKGLSNARKTQARAEMRSIVAAIKAYYNEYGKMPSHTNGQNDWTFGRKNGVAKQQNEVMNILRAVEGTSTNENYKGIIFLEISPDSMESAADKAGDSYDATDGYYIDPWGTPYIIHMDTDFDGEIGGANLDDPARTYLWDELSPAGDSTFPGITVGVMSYGPDPEEPEQSFMYSW